MSEEIDKEISALKVRLRWKRDDVAKDYVKRLVSIIEESGVYRTANLYRPRITLRERLRFIYKSSDFLIEDDTRPFSGKWFQAGNFRIGRHRYQNNKEWYGAILNDFHVYVDGKQVLWVREVLYNDGRVHCAAAYSMKHLGNITSDWVQQILNLSGQVSQEVRKRRDPEIQELEQQMERLKFLTTERN